MYIKKRRSETLHLGGYRFRTFDLGEERVFPISIGVAELGRLTEVERLYKADLARFREHIGKDFAHVPYCFVDQRDVVRGDFALRGGHIDFFSMEALHTAEDFHPLPWARDLWHFSRLKQNRKFQNSDTGAFLRQVEVRKERLVLTIGSGPYQEAAYTMNSDGLTFTVSRSDFARVREGLSEDENLELAKLAAKLHAEYGKGTTIRHAIHKQCGGKLPPIGSRIYSHLIGGAALVYTEDDEFVFGRRIPKTTAVNHGVSTPISGGFDFDKNKLSELGFPLFAIAEILREGKEEIGLPASKCRIEPLAFIREGPRGWCPDILALCFFHGTTEELVEYARENPSPHRDENRQLLTLSREDAARLVRDSQGGSILQHKGLVTLIMAIRHLESLE